MNPDLAMLEHTAKAVNTLLDAIHGRNSAPPPDEPKSDCCIAPLEQVMREVYACSACGRICSDGRVSC
jgi:hypothetical protein